jgi:hypothetical protein
MGPRTVAARVVSAEAGGAIEPPRPIPGERNSETATASAGRAARVCHDPEIEELHAKVLCAVVLERTSPTWKLDRKESTKLSLKYRRGEGGILIVSPPGSAWFAHRNDAGAVTRVDIR